MGDHFGGGHTHDLVISMKGSVEKYHHSGNDKVANFGEFRVDYSNQCSVNVGKVWGSHLRFDDSFG